MTLTSKFLEKTKHIPWWWSRERNWDRVKKKTDQACSLLWWWWSKEDQKELRCDSSCEVQNIRPTKKGTKKEEPFNSSFPKQPNLMEKSNFDEMGWFFFFCWFSLVGGVVVRGEFHAWKKGYCYKI
jgi:hypothetical protein